MVKGDDSSDNQGMRSIKEELEEKRRELQLEIEKTELELERAKLGEAVATFLNNNEQLNELLAELDLEQPLTLSLGWDAENKRFFQRMFKDGSFDALIPRPAPIITSSTSAPVKRMAAKPFGQRPPQEEDYFIPILQALRVLGWSATPEQITPLVLEKILAKLTENDFEPIPSGMFIRWECRMRFARKQMKDLHPPLLNPNSPRGLWEATELGHRHLEEWENRQKELVI